VDHSGCTGTVHRPTHPYPPTHPLTHPPIHPPTQVDFPIEDMGYLRYYLAPKIDDDMDEEGAGEVGDD
jgi:hypothetical protein